MLFLQNGKKICFIISYTYVQYTVTYYKLSLLIFYVCYILLALYILDARNLCRSIEKK